MGGYVEGPLHFRDCKWNMAKAGTCSMRSSWLICIIVPSATLGTFKVAEAVSVKVQS